MGVPSARQMVADAATIPACFRMARGTETHWRLTLAAVEPRSLVVQSQCNSSPDSAPRRHRVTEIFGTRPPPSQATRRKRVLHTSDKHTSDKRHTPDGLCQPFGLTAFCLRDFVVGIEPRRHRGTKVGRRVESIVRTGSGFHPPKKEWLGLTNGKARTGDRRAIRFAPGPATHANRSLETAAGPESTAASTGHAGRGGQNVTVHGSDGVCTEDSGSGTIFGHHVLCVKDRLPAENGA